MDMVIYNIHIAYSAIWDTTRQLKYRIKKNYSLACISAYMFDDI